MSSSWLFNVITAPLPIGAETDQATIELNRWLIGIGVAQLIVFALQLAVFGYQALKLR